MLYFSVTLGKLRLAKNTLQKHTCFRATETLGAEKLLKDQAPAPHFKTQLCWVLHLCSHLTCLDLHCPSLLWLHAEGGAKDAVVLWFYDGIWGCWGSEGGVDVGLLQASHSGSKSWLWGAAEPHYLWWRLFQIMFLIRMLAYTSSLALFPLLLHTPKGQTHGSDKT